MAKGKGQDAIDSDEEDEDYLPGADPNKHSDASDDDADGTNEDPATLLSITKQKAVDNAFLELFGYRYDASAAANDNSCANISTNGGGRRRARQRAILSSIFGRRSCAKLMQHSVSTAALAMPRRRGGGMLRLEKRLVVEVKRFAGQEIRMERMVMVPVMAGVEEDDAAKSGASAARAAAGVAMDTAPEESTADSSRSKRARGVDSLLSELSRPEKLSTISKTSADWDLFKSKNADESLKEQIESKAHGKEAYLVKKDFLNRVDGRRFELEKAERERKRTRRSRSK